MWHTHVEKAKALLSVLGTYSSTWLKEKKGEVAGRLSILMLPMARPRSPLRFLRALLHLQLHTILASHGEDALRMSGPHMCLCLCSCVFVEPSCCLPCIFSFSSAAEHHCHSRSYPNLRSLCHNHTSAIHQHRQFLTMMVLP